MNKGVMFYDKEEPWAIGTILRVIDLVPATDLHWGKGLSAELEPAPTLIDDARTIERERCCLIVCPLCELYTSGDCNVGPAYKVDGQWRHNISLPTGTTSWLCRAMNIRLRSE